MYKNELVNAKKIVIDAYKKKIAIPQFNLNNFEWTRTILEVCNEHKLPVILGVSNGAKKFMGGCKTIVNIVKNLMEYLNITIPVVLHFDHGSFENVKEALDAGFTSVMFDGSHLKFEENIAKSKQVIEMAKLKNASVELEIGEIAGSEDSVFSLGQMADVEEMKIISKLDCDFIAAGIGNVHGEYPKDWKSLNFELLEKLTKIAKKPLVLHGGSGIPKNQIKRSINLGIAKINVNTELQLDYYYELKKFIVSGESDKGKNFGLRNLFAAARPGLVKAIEEELAMFYNIKFK